MLILLDLLLVCIVCVCRHGITKFSWFMCFLGLFRLVCMYIILDLLLVYLICGYKHGVTK
jgi:hypothetical protein